jgi:hypothetical protein
VLGEHLEGGAAAGAAARPLAQGREPPVDGEVDGAAEGLERLLEGLLLLGRDDGEDAGGGAVVVEGDLDDDAVGRGGGLEKRGEKDARGGSREGKCECAICGRGGEALCPSPPPHPHPTPAHKRTDIMLASVVKRSCRGLSCSVTSAPLTFRRPVAHSVYSVSDSRTKPVVGSGLGPDGPPGLAKVWNWSRRRRRCAAAKAEARPLFWKLPTT